MRAVTRLQRGRVERAAAALERAKERKAGDCRVFRMETEAEREFHKRLCGGDAGVDEEVFSLLRAWPAKERADILGRLPAIRAASRTNNA